MLASSWSLHWFFKHLLSVRGKGESWLGSGAWSGRGEGMGKKVSSSPIYFENSMFFDTILLLLNC